MSVTRYRVRLLELKDCPDIKSPTHFLSILKCWRKSHTFSTHCSNCKERLDFQNFSYTICCQRFYYNEKLDCYPVSSIAIETPEFEFLLPQLKKMLLKAKLKSNQYFLCLPDVVYWQIKTTLVYERAIKFILKQPVTCKTNTILPVEKSTGFFKQIEEAPLNYSNLHTRSCGKSTQIRQVSFGKRCCLSARGMIVPNPNLRPNEICLPDDIVDKFQLEGQFVYLNRMPSLSPSNFVSLIVRRWHFSCFGIPLEILKQINGDFDGDEVNIYFVPNLQSQAECAFLLNSEREMGCFVSGIKLAPSQDMLVAYYLFYDEINFLPYKSRDLASTFRVIYEVFGSKRAFQAFDDMRLFYLEVLQKRTCFALTLEEMESLREMAKGVPFHTFRDRASKTTGCLVTQVLAGAKGSFEHLYQMFGSVGYQENKYIRSSYWDGFSPVDAISHARASYTALLQSGKIWQPGYGYTKIAYNIHDIKVDYLGRLIDGERVIEQDALDSFHHTDIMSEETFQYWVSKIFKIKNHEEYV